MLHGRLLGNRTITVEFACETKGRLGTDDPDDFPVDSMYLNYIVEQGKSCNFHGIQNDCQSL